MNRWAPLGFATISLMLLASGCQRSADTPGQEAAGSAEQSKAAEAKHDELQKAIEAPLDKAKAIEQPLLDSQHKTDQTMDAADKSEGTDGGG